MKRPYLDRTCVFLLELDYRLSAACYLDFVLRAEPRHHCNMLVSNLYMLIPYRRPRIERTFYRIGAPAGTRMLASYPPTIRTRPHGSLTT